MFHQSIDDRLSLWASHRADLEHSQDPLTDTWEFWKQSPFIPYNKDVDPFNQRSWPSPWQIIVDNRYDDFTRSLMIAWSLKFTNRYKDSKIEVKTLVSSDKKCYYNTVYVDNQWVINYNDNGPVSVEQVPDSFYLENLIEVRIPR